MHESVRYARGGKKRRRRRRKRQIGRDRAKERGPIRMEVERGRGEAGRIAFQRAVLLNEILIQPLFTE